MKVLDAAKTVAKDSVREKFEHIQDELWRKIESYLDETTDLNELFNKADYLSDSLLHLQWDIPQEKLQQVSIPSQNIIEALQTFISDPLYSSDGIAARDILELLRYSPEYTGVAEMILTNAKNAGKLEGIEKRDGRWYPVQKAESSEETKDYYPQPDTISTQTEEEIVPAERISKPETTPDKRLKSPTTLREEPNPYRFPYSSPSLERLERDGFLAKLYLYGEMEIDEHYTIGNSGSGRGGDALRYLKDDIKRMMHEAGYVGNPMIRLDWDDYRLVMDEAAHAEFRKVVDSRNVVRQFIP
ncbi:MAG: hypothetical protein QMD85_00200 [Candidatus Aenigmarchaeota archaeon]|nr:hypothetical protein [Candidatus Aenigmarchaeota archaeon]MDI6721948.1 hypothetical protein [Candidatus Aenigmarchaeota archaeon]